MTATRAAGTMYVCTYGRKTYAEEQNTYGAGGITVSPIAILPRQYQLGGIGAHPT